MRFPSALEVGTAATGFVQNRSIGHNVKPHLNSRIIIKVDLKDFFHSIKAPSIYRYWVGEGNWNTEAATILTAICCRNESLPQGAPTSPSLSNLVNRRLDGALLKIARKYGARYTRYADDLTFSFPRGDERAEARLRLLTTDVRSKLEEANYNVQWKKGIKILRTHQRQIVTGLSLNGHIRLPRELRNRLRGLRHRQLNGTLSEEGHLRLDGYERFNQMVERFNEESAPKLASPPERKTGEGSNFASSSRGPVILHTSSGDIVFGDQDKGGTNFGAVQSFDTRGGLVTGPDLPPSRKEWTRDQKIAIIAAVIGIAAIGISLFVPEVRQWLGLPR